MEIDFGECQNATFVAIQLSTSEFQMRLSSSLNEGHTTIVVKGLGEAKATSHCLAPERLGDKRRSPGSEVIDKVQEETKRSDRKPPGVGRGRGRGRDENSVGRSSKGIGRGVIDDGGGRGGRGKGLSGSKLSGNREIEALMIRRMNFKNESLHMKLCASKFHVEVADVVDV